MPPNDFHSLPPAAGGGAGGDDDSEYGLDQQEDW